MVLFPEPLKPDRAVTGYSKLISAFTPRKPFIFALTMTGPKFAKRFWLSNFDISDFFGSATESPENGKAVYPRVAAEFQALEASELAVSPSFHQ